MRRLSASVRVFLGVDPVWDGLLEFGGGTDTETDAGADSDVLAERGVCEAGAVGTRAWW